MAVRDSVVNEIVNENMNQFQTMELTFEEADLIMRRLTEAVQVKMLNAKIQA